MTSALEERLEQIIPRVTDGAFLQSKGIGNEIACYIFDYSANEELEVRAHLAWMKTRLRTHHSHLCVLDLDLFEVVLAYLKERGLLSKVVAMQARKNDAAVLKALKGPLAADKITDFIAKAHKPSEYDLVLLSGIGRAWPMLRAHSLLNCLHTIMQQIPLVMFYPGTFDGTTLKIFGRITAISATPGAKPYYRAFRLVARETTP